MRTIICLLATLTACVCLSAAAATPPTVVLPTHVNPQLQSQIALILGEFKIANILGPVGKVRPATTKTRAAILSVLADQKLIPTTTPGIGTATTDSFRIQVLFTLQQFGLLNGGATTTIGGGALPPGSITSDSIAPGAILTVGLADGSVTTPKLASNAVTAAKVGSELASSGMALLADGAGNASWGSIGGAAGSIPDTALSANVALLNAAQTFTNANTFNPGTNNASGLVVRQTSAGAPANDVFAVTDPTGAVKFLKVDKSGNTAVSGILSGNGLGLTSLNASAIASGTVPSANLPTASVATLGAVKVDGTTIVSAGGTISAIGAAPTGAAGGDLAGTFPNPTVGTVGGVTAANVAFGVNAANGATSANTASKLVARDASGNFIAGTITAALNGNAATATSATSFTGNLAGDVTGPQAATVVATVGGVTAANVASGANAANGATSANTASKLVARDASGNFSASGVTASGVNVAQGTLAADAQALNSTATWNNGAVAFTFIKGDVTNSASLAGSKLLDLQVGGISQFSVSPAGVITGDGSALINLNASAIASGTVPSANLPTASVATLGAVKVDGTTIVSAGGTISAVGAAPTGAAGGDLTGTFPNPTVGTVGGVTAANVASGANAANGATSANTASKLVARDASGNFIAGTITAALNGNAATATSATSFTGNLAGDVTGPQAATVVATVGGVTAANVASGANAANGATSANTASKLVARDASGNFSASGVTASGVNVAQGTLAADAQALNSTATWNNGAVAFTFIKGDVTNSASLAGSKLLDLQVGGISQFSVSPAGVITGDGSALINLNAGNVASGTLAVARGGTGLAASGGNGNFLRSNGAAWVSAPISAGDLPATIAVTNADNNFTTGQTVNGSVTATGARVTVGTNGLAGTQGTLVLDDGNNPGFQATLKPSAMGANQAFTLPAIGGTLLTSSTAAGGDLTGTYPNPTINPTASAGTNILSAINIAGATGVVPIVNGGTGSNTQNFVDLTTAQSIGGVKTFTSSPVAPTPVSATQVANKSYVDSLVNGSVGPFVQLGNGAVQTLVTNNPGIFTNTTGSGALARLQLGGIDQFTVGNTGAVTALGTVTAPTFAGNLTGNVTGSSVTFTNVNFPANTTTFHTATNPTAPVSYSLPPADGIVGGGQALTTDGAGNLTWTTLNGALPGSSGPSSTLRGNGAGGYSDNPNFLAAANGSLTVGPQIAGGALLTVTSQTLGLQSTVGALTLTPGSGTVSVAGANITGTGALTVSSAASTNAGVTAGTAVVAGNAGGSVAITAGNGLTTGNGGNITLTPGTTGSGVPGAVNIATGASTGAIAIGGGANSAITLSAPAGKISATSLDNTSIGATTPAAGSFTTLKSSGVTTLAAVTATSLNNTPIGAVTPAAGSFTTLKSTAATTLGATTATSLDNTSIGATTPAAGSFTTLKSTAATTLGATTATSLDNTSIGATTPAAGSFTTLKSTAATTLGAITATSLNNTPIGAVTPAAGSFTTLKSTAATTLGATTATSLDNTSIGATTPAAGSFTTLKSTAATTLGATTATSLDNTSIGATTPAAGSFTTLKSTAATTLGAITATSLNSTPIGAVTPAAGSFTTLKSTAATTLGATTATSLDNTSIGATTPAAGSFTTLKSTAATTLGATTATSLDNTSIGATTPAAGSFTTLKSTAATTLGATTATSLDNTSIGATTPAAGSFTTLKSSGVTTLGAALSQAGLTTTYNNIATVSNGIPSEYATADVVAKSAAIVATTLYTVPAAGGGMYRVSGYMKVTTPALTSSTLGALTLTFTDNTDGSAQTVTCGGLTSAGAIAVNSAGNSATTLLFYDVIIWAKGSSNIQYSTGYTSVGAPAMQYEVHLKCEGL